MRKFSVLTITLLVIYGFVFSATDELTVSIPLRIKSGKKGDSKILRDSFKVFVNKKPVEIRDIKREERIPGEKQLLGRNFILSFGNFYKYNSSLYKGISYFVTEILDPSDSLMLAMPGKLFHIRVTKNREKIIFNIDDILNEYFKKLSLRLVRYTKGINFQISRLKKFFESYKQEDRMTGEGTLYLEALTAISTEIGFLKKIFVSPTKNSSSRAENILGLREGDRIWIHFQNGSIYPFEKKLQSVMKQIKFHMSMTTIAESSWQKVIDTRLNILEKSLLISDIFPLESLTRTFVNTNTTFYPVLVKNRGKSEGILSIVTADLSGILEKLSVQTGGVFIDSKTAESVLRKIADHRDIYYKIFFNVKTTPGDREISVIPKDKKIRIVYKNCITEKELRKLIRFDRFEKLRVSSLRVKNGKVSFGISSYKVKEGENIGLVKVIIRLYNEKGVKVYSTFNILRAIKKSVSVNAGLPSRFSGKFLLRISVLDLISNRVITDEVPVILKD